jgi:hypothetical protein
MTIVCSSCQRYLGTQPPYHDKSVNKGLCLPCTVRQRQELRTLVLSRDRADTLPVLSNIFRYQDDLRLVVDRRAVERRRESVTVEECRRGAVPDRRRLQSLRLV